MDASLLSEDRLEFLAAVCIDMCTDMCMGMCIDMCVDMCMDICVDMWIRLECLAAEGRALSVECKELRDLNQRLWLIRAKTLLALKSDLSLDDARQLREQVLYAVPCLPYPISRTPYPIPRTPYTASCTQHLLPYLVLPYHVSCTSIRTGIDCAVL